MHERKTTTRAFRIDGQVDKQLREWAEREGVTVSFLANKALRRLVEWDIYADRFGFMSVPNEALARMFDSLSEDEVSKLGRWAGEHVYRAFTTFMFKKFNMDTVLQILPKLTSRYTKAFEYEEIRDARRTMMVLKHGRGHKYSLYYEGLAQALFADLVEREVRTEAMENALTVEFSNETPKLPAATSARAPARVRVPAD